MSIDTEDAFQPLLPERGAARPVELFATLALALCTLVAATAVSIGIARANVIALGAFSDPAPRAGCPPYCRLELAPPGTSTTRATASTRRDAGAGRHPRA